ncbi:MAG: SDR family NAD(P)-dependent oxidoreductase [Chloroflexi bacterium]|nr:SDR family NAD(P)-dependent oxidoreductase [Chloroflexota bacterium]
MGASGAGCARGGIGLDSPADADIHPRRGERSRLGAPEEDHMSLDGKVAIVAGASRGIGADIARHLAAAGAKTAVAARTETVQDPRLPGTIHSVAEAITSEGGAALPVVLNLRDAESIQACAQTVMDEWGRIDILVNNAAIFIPGTIESARERHIHLSLEVNYIGYIMMMRAVIPHMREGGGGHIINISSRGAIPPGPGPYGDDVRRGGDLLYGGIKAGLEHFSQSQAVELQDDNIAVNVLSPESGYRTPGLIFAGNDPENPDLNFEAADPMGEATVWVCQQEPSGYTGNILYDRSVLAQA